MSSFELYFRFQVASVPGKVPCGHVMCVITYWLEFVRIELPWEIRATPLFLHYLH